MLNDIGKQNEFVFYAVAAKGLRYIMKLSEEELFTMKNNCVKLGLNKISKSVQTKKIIEIIEAT